MGLPSCLEEVGLWGLVSPERLVRSRSPGTRHTHALAAGRSVKGGREHPYWLTPVWCCAPSPRCAHPGSPEVSPVSSGPAGDSVGRRVVQFPQHLPLVFRGSRGNRCSCTVRGCGPAGQVSFSLFAPAGPRYLEAACWPLGPGAPY